MHAPSLPPRYVPLEPLGKGGGGEVWSVRDRITGKVVAFKTLREGAHEREVMALAREAAALSGVEGLGVPRVLRFGRLDGSGRPYLVRELVEGKSLADHMAVGDPLHCLEAVVQAADKLTRLHRASLLHGDIKPANIIVSESGEATLVDLGLAAAWRDDGAKPQGLTPKYAAPELFDGSQLTVRAEVYALGATVAEVLSIHRARISKDVLPAFDEVVTRATARDPDQRFPSADEFKNALERALRTARGDVFVATKDSGTGRSAVDVWPIVGLDALASELLSRVAAQKPGSGTVIVGPQGAGRSALLRRGAWSLGIAARPFIWVEARTAPAVRGRGDADATGVDARAAIEIELQSAGNAHDLTVLIDDADLLDAAALAKLESLRANGARLVLVAGGAGFSDAFKGPTFEVFEMPPLPTAAAVDLIRRAAPSLSDAVAAHLVEKSRGYPGVLRSLLARLSGVIVVSPADVDRALEKSQLPRISREELVGLLDRGHFDEAAEVIAAFADDQSPIMAISRARLATSRGDVQQALTELRSVEAEALSSSDDILAATWLLYAARTALRLGEYAEAQRRASQVEERFGASAATRRAEARLVATEALTVRGLAESFASRHAEAKATLDRAVVEAREIGEPRILSLALSSLALAFQRDDHLAEAKAAYEEALPAAERAGDAGTVATARLNLAGIAKNQGDIAGAIEHLEASVDMGKRSGRFVTLRQALLNLANLDLYVGRLAKARVSMDMLAEQRRELPPHQLAQFLALEAEYAARSDEPQRAANLCAESAEAYEAMGRPLDAAEARLERVLLLAGVDGVDVSTLDREIERAVSALGGTTAHRALLSVARGKVWALQRDEAKARAAFDDALATATGSNQRDWIFRALEARAQLEAGAGQALRARRDREAALTVLEEIAERLPRDLREVYWNDSRRRLLRSAALVEPTGAVPPSKAPGEDRLARVLEINRAIAGEYDLPRLLDKVTDHAIALLRAERGFVILKSGTYTYEDADGKPNRLATTSDNSKPSDAASRSNHLSIHASRDQAGADSHARFSRSIADRVIATGEPVVTTSAREDARMADYVSVHQLMLQSVACTPIRSRTGTTIGALYLETRLRPTSSFAEELPTLTALADQVAIAIESARLVGENERRARELAKANEELVLAHAKLEELLGHRTAQLAATRRDLRSVRAVIRSHFGYEGLVGTSEAMRRVYALVDRVKDADVPVLIVGESGTGKEVVARAIHNAGARAKKPFVGINCGAIPEHLLESELFGHVRGAFTGADRDRKGLFREATEGTILLDEIGEMPQKMQAGLLRVLQEKLVRPVGSAREEPVDTRVIAATHRDLSRMVEQGGFREDLFYRLNVILVRVPSLRERIDDIPVLIDHFLGIFAARYDRDRRSVSRAALKRLMAYHWPGNVRQLENVLLNAWVLSDRRELEIDDFELPETARRPSDVNEARAPRVSTAPEKPLVTSLDSHRATERERILSALSASNWNRVKAAKLVGMPRRTFYRRLKEYGIQ
ncbi:MAG: sigma 54-interacting transcriptional regulator [Polyangiaceae bacterium]|nr:sigma 54-interacting transcriptional regulator [Polyangiaceae bacterium]